MTAARGIAVVAGDGVVKEVVPSALDVLRRAAGCGGRRAPARGVPLGREHYRRHGTMLAPGALDACAESGAGRPGADVIGDGGTTDRAEEDGVELRIERLPGVVSPVRAFDDGGIDFLCVREKAVAAFALP